MNRFLVCFLISLSLGASAEPYIRSLLSRTWEQKRIASGENGPALPLEQNSRADLLVLLHHKVGLNSLCTHYGWSPEELARRLAELKAAGLVVEASPGSNPANFHLLGDQPDRQALIAGYLAREPQFASTFERLDWNHQGQPLRNTSSGGTTCFIQPSPNAFTRVGTSKCQNMASSPTSWPPTTKNSTAAGPGQARGRRNLLRFNNILAKRNT